MKKCPACGRTFHDDFSFCLVDGEVLSAPVSEKTLRMEPSRPDDPTVRMSDLSVETVGRGVEPPRFIASETRGSRTSLWVLAVVGSIVAGLGGFAIVGALSGVRTSSTEHAAGINSRTDVDTAAPSDSASVPDLSRISATPTAVPSSSPTSAGTPTVASGDPIYWLSDVDKPPVITGGRDPENRASDTAHTEPRVVRLMVLYHRSGKVSEVKVIDGVPGITDAAVQAAFTTEFRPALKDDRPVSVWAPKEYYFYYY